ncbi:Cyclin-L1-1 [Zea mays]|uniref:Cyclin-L1-1 n=1 Tax=Zea mays TaxID=4577 RepID=A0A1D6KVT8_MAIZE|nr:Cyclin-L1-1 [Zea mays]
MGREEGAERSVEELSSLRTTLCVRFKSEVVACGVVYAAARRHRVPLPEDPPWWTVFDADEAGIQEVCSVLAHLYSLPKAQYIPVYKEYDSFTVKRISDPQALKESPARAVASDKGTPIPSSSNQEKDSVAKTIPNRVKEKSDDEVEKEKEKERDQEGGNVMLGVGILIMIAGVVTLIARGIGDVALGIEVQDTQTRRNQGAIHHTTELTTTVRIHLVKKIGIDTIDQEQHEFVEPSSPLVPKILEN